MNYIVPAGGHGELSVPPTGFRIRVVQSLKEVPRTVNEYPYVLQESSIFREFGLESFDELVIQPVRAPHSGGKYMEPFPGVVKTLAKLKEMGLKVAALTDAPRNPAELRTKMMGFDRYLDALYTLPGFDFPSSQRGEPLIAQEIAVRDERGEYRASCEVVELGREHEKPSPEGVMAICRAFGVKPEETLVVGDSLKKDIAVAKQVKALDVWAEYGTYHSKEYRERLDVISAPAITRRHAASAYEANAQLADSPTHALSNFAQLIGIVEATRP